MRPKNILSPSIFDFYNGSPSFKFIRPEPFHKSSLDKQAITKAHLICRDLNSGLVLSGNFKLQGHLLVYYKDDVDVPILVLDLLYSRLKPLEINLTYPKYKLKLATRGHSYELCFNKQATAEYWADSLRSICVLTNFYEKYQRLHSNIDNPYSQTYLIKDKATSEVFATKRFSKENLSTPTSKAALFSEIMIMRANDHPSFLKLHEVYETDRSIYLVKEYLPTLTLHSLLSDKDLPLSHCGLKAIKIMGSLLRALDYLSSRGFMHRDLNPENILIDKDGNVKITDFGLVTRLSVSNNHTDERCGAPGYIAPEVFKYDKRVISTTYNAKCDVFSAGCIFFEILFGFPLFDGKDVIEKLKLNKSYSQKEVFQRIDKEMNDPHSEITKQDLDLLKKLLCEDPQKRLSPIEALDHEYFKPAINKTVQFTQDNDILLFSNTVDQNSREQSPLQSPILSTERFFMQMTNNGNPYFSEDDLAISNRRIKSQDSSNLSTANSNTRPHSLDGLNSFGPRNRTLKTSTFFEGPTSLKRVGTFKREIKSEECDVEDTGELSDTEDEVSSIEAFLDRHNIQVSMKNPGRMSD